MQATLAIDIGGTKTAAGLVDRHYHLIDTIDLPSRRGISEFKKNIVACLKWGGARFDKIAISTPGKLIGTPKRLAPRSAQNIALFPTEFDDFPIEAVVCAMCAHYPTPFIINDALAQLCGGLMSIGIDSFVCQIVGYIGPGTGLGGGFVAIDSPQKIRFIGDGHIFDILLPRDPDDRWSPPGSHVMAEDVLSGRGFFDLTARPFGDVVTSPSLYDEFLPMVELMARYFSQLIGQINSGNSSKRFPQDAWPEDIRSQLSKTHHFLVGGSVGKTLFNHVLNRATSENGATRLYAIPHPTTAALKGVVYARDLT